MYGLNRINNCKTNVYFQVSFQMATMQRSGTLVARTIRLENPAAPVKYQVMRNEIAHTSNLLTFFDAPHA